MSENMKVSVDFEAGRFEIEGPPSEVKELIQTLSSLFYSRDRKARPSAGDSSEPSKEETPTNVPSKDEAADQSSGPAKQQEPTKKRSRKSKGKSKDYRVIDLGLNETQRSKLREFFAEKAPSRQNDQVATVGAYLKRELGRNAFSYDEIFTALKIADSKIPRNLPAVVGNMESEGIADRAEDGIQVTFATDDHVKFNLPPKPKSKDE